MWLLFSSASSVINPEILCHVTSPRTYYDIQKNNFELTEIVAACILTTHEVISSL